MNSIFPFDIVPLYYSTCTMAYKILTFTYKTNIIWNLSGYSNCKHVIIVVLLTTVNIFKEIPIVVVSKLIENSL